MLVTDKNDPRLAEGQRNSTGQHSVYLVLSDEERAKGFVRPVRTAYRHVGRIIEGDPRPLTDEETERYKDQNYAAFVPNPDPGSPVTGTFIRQRDLDTRNSNRYGGCGTVTTMGTALAETYARDPKFYGATFCVACNRHLPVGEFFWEGTEEAVGS